MAHNYPEPSIAEIAVALMIGLGTGAAVVALNTAVHTMQDIIWLGRCLLEATCTLSTHDLSPWAFVLLLCRERGIRVLIYYVVCYWELMRAAMRGGILGIDTGLYVLLYVWYIMRVLCVLLCILGL